MGGGQISLTPVLIGDFLHVLLCLFALPAPLVCSGPELSGSSSQKVPSGDISLRATTVPNCGGGALRAGRLVIRRLPALLQPRRTHTDVSKTLPSCVYFSETVALTLCHPKYGRVPLTKIKSCDSNPATSATHCFLPRRRRLDCALP